MGLVSTELWRGVGGGEGVGRRATCAHPKHPVQPLHLPGLLLCQEEREAMWGPHTGHPLIHRCHSRALHQRVVLIRVQPLGHQGEVQSFQQDLQAGHVSWVGWTQARCLGPSATHLEGLPAQEGGQEAAAAGHQPHEVYVWREAGTQPPRHSHGHRYQEQAEPVG